MLNTSDRKSGLFLSVQDDWHQRRIWQEHVKVSRDWLEVFPDKVPATLVNLINHQKKGKCYIEQREKYLHKDQDVTSQAREHRLYFR